MSDPLRRKLAKCILPRVGVFGAGDGKVEQRESDTHTDRTCMSFPLGQAGGRSWWAERAQLGQDLDAQLWNFPTTISRPHSELFLPVKWGRLPAAPSLGQSWPCEVAGKYSCSLAWERIQWLSHTTSLPLAGPLSPPKPETQCAQLEQPRSTFVGPAVRVHSGMSLVPQLCLKCRQNLWFLCRGMFPSLPTILIPAEYPTIQLNSDTVGSLGDRTRSYRLKSQSYKTTPTSSANSMSRLSLVFWTGCKSEVLVSLPWGIARAAYRTQRNILLTRPPIDYKRI